MNHEPQDDDVKPEDSASQVGAQFLGTMSSLGASGPARARKRLPSPPPAPPAPVRGSPRLQRSRPGTLPQAMQPPLPPQPKLLAKFSQEPPSGGAVSSGAIASAASASRPDVVRPKNPPAKKAAPRRTEANLRELKGSVGRAIQPKTSELSGGDETKRYRCWSHAPEGVPTRPAASAPVVPVPKPASEPKASPESMADDGSGLEIGTGGRLSAITWTSSGANTYVASRRFRFGEGISSPRSCALVSGAISISSAWICSYGPIDTVVASTSGSGIDGIVSGLPWTWSGAAAHKHASVQADWKWTASFACPGNATSGSATSSNPSTG